MGIKEFLKAIPLYTQQVFLEDPDVTVIPRGTQALVIQEYPERQTRTGTYRQQERSRKFNLPGDLEQRSPRRILSVVSNLLLPPLSDADIQTFSDVFDLVDQVLFEGLQDSGNWVLPKGLTEIPFVKQTLDDGSPLEQILGVLLESFRTFIWMYIRDLEDFVKPLSDLEDALAYLISESQPQADASSSRVT